MVLKGSRRRESSTRIARLFVGRADTMYRNNTTVVTVDQKRRVILILTPATIHKQVQVKKIRSFRNGPDGVGSRSWKAKLQIKEVEKQIN